MRALVTESAKLNHISEPVAKKHLQKVKRNLHMLH
jgi:hypothetical protein